MSDEPKHKPGCCVDRLYRAEQAERGRDVRGFPHGCDPSDCMILPAGQTCSTCVHHYRCTTMFGAKSDNVQCGFFPRRFRSITSVAETEPNIEAES